MVRVHDVARACWRPRWWPRGRRHEGKWAQGIPPRNFTWVIRDHLAISERPGGFSANHRRVRRQEEIIWLKVQQFDRIISLLASPHNLASYEEEGIASAHYPIGTTGDLRPQLSECYRDIDASLAAGHRVLVHQDELGDRLMGVVAGTCSGPGGSRPDPRWSR